MKKKPVPLPWDHEQLSLGIKPPSAPSAMGEFGSQRQVEGMRPKRKKKIKPLADWPGIGTEVTLPLTVFDENGVGRFKAIFSGQQFTVDPRQPEAGLRIMGRCAWRWADLKELGLSDSLLALLPKIFLVRLGEIRLVEDS